MSSYNFEKNEDPDEISEVLIIGNQIDDDDEETKKREYKPVWEQEVTDENGKRRFHGAFTGGFSAGYYNTVGSKEGWKPSTFSSSRDKRGTFTKHKIEDFMDEEDMEEMRGKQLKATKEFTGDDDTAISQESKSQAVKIHGLISDLMVLPPKKPIGIRLLRVMGWREGQGIGPRQKIKKKNQSKPQGRVYGAQLPPEMILERRRQKENDEDGVPSEEPEEEPEDNPFHPLANTIAPQNNPMFDVKVKKDRFGVGYDPMKMNFEMAEYHKQVGKLKGASVNYHQGPASGFGTGVYEDEDDDIYAHDSRSNYVDEIHDEPVFKKSTTLPPPPKRPKLTHHENDTRRKCRDGGPPPLDYVFESLKLSESGQGGEYYPPPDIPRDFIPRHTFPDDAPTPESLAPHLHMVTLKTSDALQKSAGFQKGKALSSSERGALLGETPLPVVKVPPKSVWQLMSAKDQSRLQKIREKYGIQTQLESSETPTPPVRKPQTTPAAAIVTQLLASRFSASGNLHSVNPDSTTTEGKESKVSEKGEFGTHNMNVEFIENGPSKEENAAKMKMFGTLTRKREDFFPSRILCKRFNVPVPHQDKRNQMKKSVQAPSHPKRTSVQERAEKQHQNFIEQTGGVMPNEDPTEIVNAGANETLKMERPHMDLFSAIFDSDDEKEKPPSKLGADPTVIEEEELEPDFGVSLVQTALKATEKTKAPTDMLTNKLPDDNNMSPSVASSIPSRKTERHVKENVVFKPHGQHFISATKTDSSKPNPYLYYPAEKRDVHPKDASKTSERATHHPHETERRELKKHRRDTEHHRERGHSKSSEKHHERSRHDKHRKSKEKHSDSHSKHKTSKSRKRQKRASDFM